MELIYSHDGVEQGIVRRFTADFEVSTALENNTFEICVPLDGANRFSVNDFIYEENTELGGIIDGMTIDTAAHIMSLNGRTWRGVLGSKILEPPTGFAYYEVAGGVNQIIAEIITKIGLDSIFYIDTTLPGKYISWRFDRYVDAYTGILKMLSRNGMKLELKAYAGTIELFCQDIIDYSNISDITSYQFDFKIAKQSATVNHLIGLGSGELVNRLVCHKYVQEDGSIGDTQYFFGKDERAAVYDYSYCESLEELVNGTIEKLMEYAIDDAVEIVAYNINASLGDKFLAVDETTGISAEQYVIDKIITATDSTISKTQYKVGGTIL